MHDQWKHGVQKDRSPTKKPGCKESGKMASLDITWRSFAVGRKCNLQMSRTDFSFFLSDHKGSWRITSISIFVRKILKLRSNGMQDPKD